MKKQTQFGLGALTGIALVAGVASYNAPTIKQQHPCEGLTPKACVEQSHDQTPQSMQQYDEEIAPSEENWISWLKERNQQNLTYDASEAEQFRELPYFTTINEASKACDLSVPFSYSVAFQESKLDSQAVSRSGAQGTFQLMPATAQYLGVENAFDPEQNARAGVQYLCNLRDQHGFEDIEMLPAAYNAGPGRISRTPGETLDEKLEVLRTQDPRKAHEVNSYVSNITEMYTHMREEARQGTVTLEDLQEAHRIADYQTRKELL